MALDFAAGCAGGKKNTNFVANRYFFRQGWPTILFVCQFYPHSGQMGLVKYKALVFDLACRPHAALVSF